MCIRDSSNNLPRELVHPFPNFFQGVKKCENCRHIQRRSTLSHPRLKTQQDISTLKQSHNSAMITLCPRQVWRSSVHAAGEQSRESAPLPRTGRRKCAKLENVALANALQLEAARRRAVPICFNFAAHVKFEFVL